MMAVGGQGDYDGMSVVAVLKSGEGLIKYMEKIIKDGEE